MDNIPGEIYNNIDGYLNLAESTNLKIALSVKFTADINNGACYLRDVESHLQFKMVKELGVFPSQNAVIKSNLPKLCRGVMNYRVTLVSDRTIMIHCDTPGMIGRHNRIWLYHCDTCNHKWDSANLSTRHTLTGGLCSGYMDTGIACDGNVTISCGGDIEDDVWEYNHQLMHHVPVHKRVIVAGMMELPLELLSVVKENLDPVDDANLKIAMRESKAINSGTCYLKDLPVEDRVKSYKSLGVFPKFDQLTQDTNYMSSCLGNCTYSVQSLNDDTIRLLHCSSGALDIKPVFVRKCHLCWRVEYSSKLTIGVHACLLGIVRSMRTRLIGRCYKGQVRVGSRGLGTNIHLGTTSFRKLSINTIMNNDDWKDDMSPLENSWGYVKGLTSTSDISVTTGEKSRQNSTVGVYSPETSSCGHYQVAGRCQMLCDDYLDENRDGYCYTRAFLDRFTSSELGAWPLLADVYCRMLSMDTEPFSIMADRANKTIHFSNNPSLGERLVKWHKCCTCCGMNKSLWSDTFIRPVELTCDLCKGNVRIFSIFSDSIMTWKVGGVLQFSLRNLAAKYSPVTEFTHPNPRFYYSNTAITDEVIVSRDDDILKIQIGDHFMTGAITSDKVKTCKHDFVGSCWKEDTDEELSLLGIDYPEGRLTPDCIIVETKVVLELATCGTDFEKSLRASFERKSVKYRGELSNLNVSFFVLVVSPQCVYSNLDLDQVMVDSLTQRMRLAQMLHVKIAELVGRDIFEEELSENMKIARSSFMSVPDYKPEDVEGKFSNKEIREFEEKPTYDDQWNARIIMEKTLKATKNFSVTKRKVLEDYLNSFTVGNTRLDHKRICNFPMILPEGEIKPMSTDISTSMGLEKLWTSSLSVKEEEAVETELIITNSQNNLATKSKHHNKRLHMFKPQLTLDDKLSLAKSGIGAKAFEDHAEVKEHVNHSKLSFHPGTFTSDIDNFIERDLMCYRENNFISQEVKRAVVTSKNISTNYSKQESIKIWEMNNNTLFSSFTSMITEVFTELSYNYKHWTGSYKFLKRKLSCGIEMIIYNPKEVLFVSFAIPRDGCTILDTGRLGPKLHVSPTHYFSDFCSYDQSFLEHMVKCGPYMSSIMCHLQSASGSEPGVSNEYVRDSMAHILLLYLNNKRDSEEIVTNQRYLFMKLLEDVSPDPYMFVDRLPKVLRSRLTVHLLRRTIGLMDHYNQSKILKVPVQGKGIILYDYTGIRSIFSSGTISLSLKINEFYFGYVVSKDRNSKSDQTFKVLNKLIKQEHKFRDSTDPIFTTGLDSAKFSTNKHLLKVFSDNMSGMLKNLYGENFKDKIEDDFLRECAKTGFSDLATLKASARPQKMEFIPSDKEGVAKVIYDSLVKDNPDFMIKRPKALEAITYLIRDFEIQTGKIAQHITQLAPWCLNELMVIGYFNSDQFEKSQHGGLREIHILEIKARLVQFFIEMVSITICKYFPSETTVNSHTKANFVREHYRRSEKDLTDPFTISKSSDATTWCQNHHSSHLAAFLMPILPESLKNFYIAGLSLWPRKRLTFSMKQVASLQANLNLHTSNPTYMRFKKEFAEGKGMFLKPHSNTIEVHSGMFQGILHRTSSLYHVMIQESMAMAVSMILKSKFSMNTTSTIVEGSDDSAHMLSMDGPMNKHKMIVAKRMLLWKDELSPYLSVYSSPCKTSTGTHDLVEYNSEWHVRHKVIKPTFRWVSACMEMSVTERFIDRFRIFNNVLGQCLEGGATTLECAVIQLCQSQLHYNMLGMQTQRTSSAVLDMMMRDPEPLLGFFPSDFDMAAGVTGVEFQLFCLFKFSSYGHNLKDRSSTDTELSYMPGELPNFQKVKDLQSVRLKFSNMSLFYNLVSRMPLENIETAIEIVTKHPELLFEKSKTWEDEQHSLVLKVFSPGVKDSISNRSPTLRMMSAGSYIQTFPCFTVFSSRGEMRTLISLLEDNSIKARSEGKPNEEEVFPLLGEFSKTLKNITRLTEETTVTDQHLARTSKTKVIVFEVPQHEFQVIDMCKVRWFGIGMLPLSRGQFRKKWEELVERYHFLSSIPGIEGFNETCSNLRMNPIQTKGFLESLSNRTRNIVLYDTYGKGSNLMYTLSRIYWPNKKLMSNQFVEDTGLDVLRSKLFSVLTYWCSKSMKDNLVSDMIIKSKNFLDSHEIPTKALKLKIFYDFLNGHDKINLVGRIMDLKQGTLGYFSQIQKGYGKDREGTGRWIGLVCGISTELHMQRNPKTKENECTKIVVNNLSNTISLSNALFLLLKEFNLSYPANPRHSQVWLTRTGKLVPSSSVLGIPVMDNKMMVHNVIENIENWKWSLETNKCNIRLRVREGTRGNFADYTILSDTYHAGDWFPGNIMQTNDYILDKWSQGQPATLKTLEDTLGALIPKTRSKFQIFMKSLYKNVNDLDWDMTVLRSTIISVFRLKEISTQSMHKEEPIDMKRSKRFVDMLETFDPFDDDSDLEEAIGMWADEPEMEFDLNLEEGDDEDIDNILKLLTEGDDLYEDKIDSLEHRYNMPVGNNFFLSINHVSQTTVGMPIKDLFTTDENFKVEGLLGQVLSYVKGQYRIGKNTGMMNDILSWEDTSAIDAGSIVTSDDLEGLSNDKLEETMKGLEMTMATAPEGVCKLLQKTYNMYDRMRTQKLRTDDMQEETLDYKTSMTIIALEMSKMKKLPIDLQLVGDIAHQILGSFIENEVSKENKMTHQEKTSIILSMGRKIITGQLLNFISDTYEVNIKTKWNSFTCSNTNVADNVIIIN